MYALSISKMRSTQYDIKVYFINCQNMEIDGNIYQLIKNLYSKTKCSIKIVQLR